MEFLAPCAGLLMFALFLGGIFGLGWVVIQPLGVINRTRVKTARFQMLDLLLLVILLQPSLAAAGWLNSQYFDAATLIILALLLGITLAAWYGMTGALSKAGVTHTGKRAAAALVILPMICVAVPAAVIGHFAAVFYLFDRGIDLSAIVVGVTIEIAFVAVLFACRRLSRWIAAGVCEQPQQNESPSSSEVGGCT